MSDIPDWFGWSVDIEAKRGCVEVSNADIRYCFWSDAGKPGLLFVHGHSAHSRWWDFIAPHYKNGYQVAALDLSGMGDSDHRDNYSTDMFADEIIATADALKMPENTIVVAHSFGGIISLRVMVQKSSRFKGLILVDSGVKYPNDEKAESTKPWSKQKVYPSQEIAIKRFRLLPPQECDNQYLVRYIAQHSLDAIDEGFVWKFDRELISRMHRTGDTLEDLRSLTNRCALIYGERSKSFGPKSAAYMKAQKPELELHEIPNAQHHLFLDQPVMFMDRLSLILDEWE